MTNRKTDTFTMRYCDGCSKFCWIGTSYEPYTKIYRPLIGQTTIYDITMNNELIFPVFAEHKLALELSNKITQMCPRNRLTHTR